MGETEKRLILFLVLSVAIVYLFTLFNPTTPPPAPPSTPATVETPVLPGPSALPDTTPPSPEADRPPARSVTIETPLYRAIFSSEGGLLQRWELKRFTESLDGDDPVILYPPVDIEPQGAPLAVRLPGEDAALTDQTVYRLEGTDAVLSASHPSTRLLFTTSLPDPAQPGRRLSIEKTLLFHVDSYRVDVAVRVDGATAPYQLTLGDSFGIHQGQAQWQERFIGHRGPVTMVDGELVQDKPDSLSDEPVIHTGTIQWTALEGKYFIAALIPTMPSHEAIVEKLGEFGVQAGLLLTPGQRHELALYAGPKEYKQLSALRSGVEQTIDFGWFMFWSWSFVKWIAKPLFLLLQFVHGYTHNYGVAIILVTVLIKILFIPLTHKSYSSMKAMQALQPKMAELQKKYKDDKERFNREMFSLYKTHKVNPFGGCLPMFLQIPVFVAFFNILYTTIELRHAPFAFWIRDLSNPDPFYILPIIMGVSMFVQQKIQPSAMDPRQARIMLMLPIVFTFFFLNFPSGLVLYWLFNNLLTIAQQYVTIKLQPPTPLPAK